MDLEKRSSEGAYDYLILIHIGSFFLFSFCRFLIFNREVVVAKSTESASACVHPHVMSVVYDMFDRLEH